MSETNGTRRATPAEKTPAKAAARRTAARTAPRRAAKKPGAGATAFRGILDRAKRLTAKLAAGRGGAKAPKKDGKRRNLLQSRFYRVYFGLLALAAVLIVIGTVWLNGVLRDYESAQPIHVADEVAKIFEEQDFDRLYALDSSAQSIAGGDQSFYVETMRDITAGKEIAWSEAFSASEDERRYNVTVGSDRFATFTLVPSGETSPRGNRLWKLGTVDTNVVTQTELDETLGERTAYRITAPENCTVTVDGAALTAEDAVKTGITLLPEDFLPSGIDPVKLTQYAFESRSERPVVEVKDASGAVQALREDGENAWICGPEDNAEFREKYAGGIAKLAQQMAKYTSGDVSQREMLRSAVDDSPAYTLIKRFSNYWAPTHKYAEFKNVQVSDCILWSDSCFTCHVTFDFILRTRRGTEQTYATAYTMCVVRRGSTAKLYNLQMN